MYGDYRQRPPDFQIFMDSKMREAETQARQEYDDIVRSTYQSIQPAPQSVTTNQSFQSAAANQNNSMRVDVSGFAEAEKYPVNKDGDTIFFVDEDNGALYCKWLNLGDGKWILDIYDRRVDTETNDAPIIEDQAAIRIDALIESVSIIRDEVAQLKDLVIDLQKKSAKEEKSNAGTAKGNHKVHNKPAGPVGKGETVRDD